MKYVANLLFAINTCVRRSHGSRHKAVLEPRMIVDLITAGACNSRVFELRAPMTAKGRYDDVTMKNSVWDKDMQVIGDYARRIRVPTPIFNATKGDYIKAMKTGRRQGYRRGLRRARKDGEGEAKKANRPPPPPPQARSSTPSSFAAFCSLLARQ